MVVCVLRREKTKEGCLEVCSYFYVLMDVRRHVFASDLAVIMRILISSEVFEDQGGRMFIGIVL